MVKFIFLIFVFLYINIESKRFSNGGYLQKDKSIFDSDYHSIYINTSEFKDDSNVYLKFKVEEGYFKEDFLYYGGYSSTPQNVELETIKDSYYTTSIIQNNPYVDKHSSINSKYEVTYYKIPIPKEQYLFVSVPTYIQSGLGGSVEISFDSRLTISEIIGICVAASLGFILITFGIIYLYLYICRKRRTNNNVFQSTNNNLLNLVEI